MPEAELRLVYVAFLVGQACAGEKTPQQVCEDYATSFASAAAVRCERGTIEDNTAAFRSAAGVGVQCELVRTVRDRASLELTCLPWLEKEADCALFDDPEAFRAALPEACLRQLEVAGDQDDP